MTMKIAIVTTNFPRWEGDFRVPFIFDAAKAMHENGHEVRIITTHQPGAAEYEVIQGLEIFRAKYLPEKFEVLQKDAAGIPAAWKEGFLQKLSMLPFFWNLCRKTAKFARGFDIIHANWSLSGLAAYLTKPFHHCPYIVTVHGSDIFKTADNPFLKFPVKIALKHANHIIAVSNALAEATQAFDVTPEKITVVPTGVDIRKFPMGEPELREKILLLILMIALPVFLYIKFLFLPENERIKKLNNELITVFENQEVLLNYDSDMNYLNHKIEEKEINISNLKCSIFNKNKAADIILELDSIASRFNMQIDDITFSASEDLTIDSLTITDDKNAYNQKLGLSRLEVEFVFEGSYNNVMNLLDYYEMHENIVIVEEFEILFKENNVCNGSVLIAFLTVNNKSVKKERK